MQEPVTVLNQVSTPYLTLRKGLYLHSGTQNRHRVHDLQTHNKQIYQLADHASDTVLSESMHIDDNKADSGDVLIQGPNFLRFFSPPHDIHKSRSISG